VDEYATKNEPIRVEQIYTDYETWMAAHGEVCTLGKISFGKELSKIPGVSTPYCKKVRGVVARYRTIL
jgi:phage/plasmid-associated DNA primase